MREAKGCINSNEPLSIEWDAGMPDHAMVRLRGGLTVGAVEGYCEMLTEVIARGTTISVDTEHLDVVDVAGIQFLIACRRYAERAGKLFFLASPASGHLRRSLIAAGLIVGEDEDGNEETGLVDAFWLAG
ncbi:MAG: STAS domain-containing protein [Alphaproteobacteria bacterium]|nr:STAS domain-containing protein [Alphaproteobacteria bacterium]